MRYSNECYSWHTFSQGAIYIPKIKWLQSISYIYKLKSGQESIYRQTNGQTDRQTRLNQYIRTPQPQQLHCAGGIKKSGLSTQTQVNSSWWLRCRRWVIMSMKYSWLMAISWGWCCVRWGLKSWWLRHTEKPYKVVHVVTNLTPKPYLTLLNWKILRMGHKS